MKESDTLPESWAVAPLGDLCEVVMGQSPPSATYNDKMEGLPFFQGKAEFTALFPKARKWCSAPGKVAEANDVLLSVRAPVGPTNLAPSRCCVGRGLAALRPVGGVGHRFVLYAVRAYEGRLAEQATGTTFGAVSGRQVRHFPLPLAPLPEQRRIVAKIEELFSILDAGVAALERVQANLKRYRASVLKAAVEGRLTEEWRARNPDVEPASAVLERILRERRRRWEEEQLAKFAEKGRKPPKDWQAKYREPRPPDDAQLGQLSQLPDTWSWSTLGECFEVHVGATPSRGEPSYWGGGIPWVSSGEVQFCRVIETEETITSDGLAHSSTRRNPAGSVLLGMIGEGRTRGQAAILGIDACNNQNCAAIWVSRTPVRPEFVFFWLWSRYEITRGVGSGNNQPALNKTRVEGLPLALPPLAEQEEIVAEVERRLSVVDEMEKQVQAGLKRAARLRQAVLKRAFEGRLVPQDPNDEPASVLLERIRAEREANAAIRASGRPAKRQEGRHD